MNLRKDHYRSEDVAGSQPDMGRVAARILRLAVVRGSRSWSLRAQLLRSSRATLHKARMFMLPAREGWSVGRGVRVNARLMPAGLVPGRFVLSSGMCCAVNASRWQLACLRKARIWRRWHVTGYLRVYKSMPTDRCLTHARSVGAIRRRQRAASPRL